MSNPIHRPLPPYSLSDIVRLVKHLKRIDTCQVFIGGKTGNGYGVFGFGNGRYPAHRVAYYFATRYDPGTLDVCHTCDNPLCCNPRHLFLGTQDDNNKDRAHKGRYNNHGRKNPRARLTEETVREILESKEHALDLANRYNVCRATIYNVRTGRTWKQLERRLPDTTIAAR